MNIFFHLYYSQPIVYAIIFSSKLAIMAVFTKFTEGESIL